MTNSKIITIQPQLLLFALIFIFSGCIKNQLERAGDIQHLSKVKAKEIIRFGVPQIVKSDSFIYKNQIMEKGKKNNKMAMRLEDCDPENWDYTSPIFEGFTRTLFSCDNNDYAILTFKWKIQMLGSIFTSSPNTYGKLTFTQAGFSSLVVTPSLSVSILSAGTYPGTGEPFTEYELTMSYSMPYSNYCGYETVSSRFYLDVDYCSSNPGDIRFISGTSGYKSLTPNEYKVYDCNANSAYPSPSFSIYPLFLACDETCHQPLLGFTPNYLVHYRKVGVSTWSTVVVPYPYDSTISVSSTGSYEYQTCGQINTDGDYSAWTSIQTFLVF